MALSPMYPSKSNSPQTALAADITASATSMTLADASILPPAPNLCTIGIEDNAEVVCYTNITGNVVSGLVRGMCGTIPSAWSVGTEVARNYTSYDHDTFIENIRALDENKLEFVSWGDIGGTLAEQTDLKGALDNKLESVSWGDIGGNLSNQTDLKAALDEKANLNSPALTGVPTAPTPAIDDETTKIATTKYVANRIAILEAILNVGQVGAHNVHYHDENLGAWNTDWHSKISGGTFDGMYIGQYFTMNITVNGRTFSNEKCRIWGFDTPFYNKPAENNFHFALCMPEHNLLPADGSTTHYMNTENNTSAGYKGQPLRTTYLPMIQTGLENAFGASYIKTHRELICNKATNGKTDGWEWVDTKVEIPSEVMMYGSTIWSNWTDGGSGYNVGTAYPILPLAMIAPWHVRNGENYWLRDVASASWFASVPADGNAHANAASGAWVGVRPFFLLS